MESANRQKEILELLHSKGRVSVSELSRTLFVSEMTVRRDLAEMERCGFLYRYRGGAFPRYSSGEMPITERMLIDKEEKEALAERCKEYLADGQTVFIDSSSTCQFIISRIAALKDMKILTNSVKALLAASELHIPCLLIGGEYYEQDMCLVGPIAEESAKDFNVDIAFFTTAAYSEEDGIISDFDLKQIAIRKIIMNNSKKNVFLFEKSKCQRKLIYTLCRADEADAIITE
jgi:DeoR/GlpR family transcriptional regulator of sugar metabolism